MLHNLDRQPVEIRSVVQRVVNGLDALAQIGRHRVLNQIPPDLVAFGDAEAVYRVMMNLLSNALKYSPPGRPVLFEGRVQVVPTPQKGSAKPLSDSEAASGSMYVSMVEVMVRDWGYGIEPIHLELIFERFTRLERNLTRPVRGSGLGLAISRELVSLMGGTLHARSAGPMALVAPSPTFTSRNCHARLGLSWQVGGSSMQPVEWDNGDRPHTEAPQLWEQPEVDRAIEALRAWLQATPEEPSGVFERWLALLENQLAVSQEWGFADVELLARLIRATQEELLLLTFGAQSE